MADKRDGLWESTTPPWWFEFAGLRITLTDLAVNISSHGIDIAAIHPADYILHDGPYITALANPTAVRQIIENGHRDGFVTYWDDGLPTMELGKAVWAAARAEGLRAFTRNMWMNAVTRGQTDDGFETWQLGQWEASAIAAAALTMLDETEAG